MAAVQAPVRRRRLVHLEKLAAQTSLARLRRRMNGAEKGPGFRRVLPQESESRNEQISEQPWQMVAFFFYEMCSRDSEL